MKNKTERWQKMTARELAAATAAFDREFVADTTTPLPAEVRKRWEKAKRKRGRPRVGAGSRAVSVTIETGLLRDADRLAKNLGVSRAAVIAKGLRSVLKAG